MDEQNLFIIGGCFNKVAFILILTGYPRYRALNYSRDFIRDYHKILRLNCYYVVKSDLCSNSFIIHDERKLSCYKIFFCMKPIKLLLFRSTHKLRKLLQNDEFDISCCSIYIRYTAVAAECVPRMYCECMNSFVKP